MKISIPSIDYLLDQTRATLRRFPATTAFALGAFWVAATQVQRGSEKSSDELLRALLVFILGIPLAMSARFFREGRSGKAWLQALPAAVVGGLYLVFRRLPDQGMFFLFAQLSLVFHLLVSFALVWSDPDRERFWQFNRVLFLRFIATAVFSNAIYAGVALCLGSLHLLFKVTIPGEVYLDLWFLCVFVFNTLFFCAGAPTRESLESLRGTYPRLLKIFSQYVLVPLLVVYGLILYAYLARVLARWEIPKGQVAGLVSGFSIVGVLTNLLLHPLSERREHRWVRLFGTGFYAGILPLLVLMAVALYQRIAPYAVTENRYILCLLCLWLFGVSVFFLIRREKSVKWIPVSLAFLALVTTFGPVSVRSVAERSQLKRLMAILERNGLVGPDGVIRKAEKDLGFEDGKEASNLFEYLLRRHGLGRLKPRLPAAALHAAEDAMKPSASTRARYAPSPTTIMSALGLTYRTRWDSKPEEEPLNFHGRSDGHGTPIDGRGRDLVILNIEKGSWIDPKAEDTGWRVTVGARGAGDLVLSNGSAEAWRMDLLAYVREHKDDFTHKGNPLFRPVIVEHAGATLVIEILNANLSKDKPRITYFKGHLLWSKAARQ